MQIIGWGLAGTGLVGLFVLVWWQGFAEPHGYLNGAESSEVEAAYCLAVVERISEITRGKGEPWLEAHLDQQVDFWRPRAGIRPGQGRATLGKNTADPTVNEGAYLHLAVQDCAHRAVAYYGVQFSFPDSAA